MILIYLDRYSVKALIDSGASKSCIKINLNFLRNINMSDSAVQLQCANREWLNCNKNITLLMRISHQFSEHSFICVKNISVDCIVGMDFIRSLSIRKYECHITLNDQSLSLYNAKAWHYGINCSRTSTEHKKTNFSIKIRSIILKPNPSVLNLRNL